MPRAISCPLCGEQYFKASLPFHLKACAAKSGRSVAPCPMCGIGIAPRLLGAHMKTCTGSQTARAGTAADADPRVGGRGGGGKVRPATSAEGLSAAGTALPVSMAACRVCGRRFRDDRLTIHEAACAKANTRRPVFRSADQRRSGIESGGSSPAWSRSRVSVPHSPISAGRRGGDAADGSSTSHTRHNAYTSALPPRDARRAAGPSFRSKLEEDVGDIRDVRPRRTGQSGRTVQFDSGTTAGSRAFTAPAPRARTLRGFDSGRARVDSDWGGAGGALAAKQPPARGGWSDSGGGWGSGPKIGILPTNATSLGNPLLSNALQAAPHPMGGRRAGGGFGGSVTSGSAGRRVVGEARSDSFGRSLQPALAGGGTAVRVGGSVRPAVLSSALPDRAMGAVKSPLEATWRPARRPIANGGEVLGASSMSASRGPGLHIQDTNASSRDNPLVTNPLESAPHPALSPRRQHRIW